MTKQDKSASVSIASLFFNATKPKSQKYNLDGVGEVDIFELKEAGVSQIRLDIDKEKDTAKRGKLFAYGLIIESVKLDGKSVFSEADIPFFSESSNASVEKLTFAVLAMNGYDDQLGK